MKKELDKEMSEKLNNTLRVFDWDKRQQSLDELGAYACHILDETLIDRMRNESPEYCYEDDLSWLPGHEDIVRVVTEAFMSVYGFVRGYHGCRPKSLMSYMKEGVKTHSRSRLQEEFHHIYRDIPESYRAAVVEASSESLDETGKAFFVSDREGFSEEIGHYTLRGSEYIFGLAARLNAVYPGIEDFRDRLLEIGVPTVLSVNIPIGLIPEYGLREIVYSLLAAWGSGVLNLPDLADAQVYVIKQDLPEQCIKSHFHLDMISDPHNMYIESTSHPKTCDACEV